MITWDDVLSHARDRFRARFGEDFDAEDERYLSAFRLTEEADIAAEDEARRHHENLSKATRGAIHFVDGQEHGDVAGGIITQGLMQVRPTLAALAELLRRIGEGAQAQPLVRKRAWAPFVEHVTALYSSQACGGTALTDADVAVLHVLAGYRDLTDAELARCERVGDALAVVRRRVAAARAKG